MKNLSKLFLLTLCGLIINGQLAAVNIQPQKPTVKAIAPGVLRNLAKFAANVSVGFFALGQSSYHLGNLLSGTWYESQLKGTNAYSQSIRFTIGMVGTSLLLMAVSCLDHFGYSDLAGNADELVETENIVDGTAQAPVN